MSAPARKTFAADEKTTTRQSLSASISLRAVLICERTSLDKRGKPASVRNVTRATPFCRVRSTVVDIEILAGIEKTPDGQTCPSAELRVACFGHGRDCPCIGAHGRSHQSTI